MTELKIKDATGRTLDIGYIVAHHYLTELGFMFSGLYRIVELRYALEAYGIVLREFGDDKHEVIVYGYFKDDCSYGHAHMLIKVAKSESEL